MIRKGWPLASLSVLDIVIVLAAAGSAAWLSLILLRPHLAPRDTASEPPSLSFTFRGDALQGTCDAGWHLLRHGRDDSTTFGEVLTLLTPRFAGVDATDPPNGRYPTGDSDDPAILTLSGTADTRCLTLTDPRAASARGVADLHSGVLRKRQGERLEALAQAAPYPVWLTSETGDVTWSNAAYRDLSDRIARDGPDAPHKSFFLPPDGDVPKDEARRLSITVDRTSTPLWFDVSATQSPWGIMNFALDVTPVVNAEIAQRNFVQTLTKTFAQLSIGLAIFDRSRQLALFNPALIDLTAMPADFLSARPTLLSFFDRLRDARMMPEPKDYSSWRERFADLVAAASDGRYSETWSLPNNATYRVTGRPHPDGAIAFLFEDISAEITLARRFRDELDRSNAVLDGLHVAVAVFAPSGTLTFVNRAYRHLWNADPETAFAETTIIDATRLWQEGCKPSPVWGDLREYVVDFRDRVEWGAQVETSGGDILLLRCTPLPGNVTVISFAAPDETALAPVQAAMEDA